MHRKSATNVKQLLPKEMLSACVKSLDIFESSPCLDVHTNCNFYCPYLVFCLTKLVVHKQVE